MAAEETPTREASWQTASASVTINDAALRRQLPMRQFEYVTATFAAADTDTVIPITVLRPEDPETLRWLDITPGTVYTGTDARASVYRSSAPDRMPFGATYLVLRSTVANYSTRLLVFLERS
jgi:hypothetical protein